MMRTHTMYISGVSGFGLSVGRFNQFLTELSACYMSIFLFSDDNLSKYE